jgi:hypothetical protein
MTASDKTSVAGMAVCVMLAAEQRRKGSRELWMKEWLKERPVFINENILLKKKGKGTVVPVLLLSATP